MNQIPSVPLGTTLTIDFVTHAPTTGANGNADSTPTAEVFEDTTDVALLTPTVVLRALKIGNYRVPVVCTTANGFELGKTYNVVVSATVGGVAGKAVIATFLIGEAVFYGSVVANAGNTASTFKTDRTESTNDHWKDAVLVFVSGALAGQARGASSYTGATVFISFAEAFTAAPSAGDLFVLIPIARLTVAEVQSGLATASALSTVQADTDDLQTRIPAALVSGRIDASVGAMAANVLTATAIAADAITAAKIAPDAIGASELAADAVTEIQSGLATASAVSAVQADTDDIQTRLPAALVSGRIDASVGAMAAAVLTATAIAADAITAAKIAPDAIGASELAADAVAEIQVGLATSAALATVQADTDDIQTRLPSALVSGRIDASVGAMAAAVLTATAIAADAITAAKIAPDAIGASELAADAVAEIQSGLATASALSTVQADTDDIQTRLPAALDVSGFMKSQVKGMDASTVTAAAIATDAIDADAIKTDAVTEIQTGLATATALAAVQSDTDDIQTRLPAALVGGRIDASVGAMAAAVLTATAIAADAITAAKIAPDAIGASELASDAVAEIQSGLATATAVASVQSDTDDIQARLPAALDGSGFMKAQIKGIDADAITAAAIATDAIGAAELAAGAVTEIATAAAAAALTSSGIATDYAPGTIGWYIGQAFGTVVDPAPGANTATVFKTDLAGTEPNQYKDALIKFRDGVLAGQVKKCTAFNQATGFITVAGGFSQAPVIGDTFDVMNQ